MALNWRGASWAGRQIASYAAIIFITAAVAEGLFEMMLRYPAWVPDSILPALREYYYNEDQPYIQYMPACAKYDPQLTYTLKPGSCRFAGREFNTTVTVNSLGVRDDEQSLHAPRVFVLGDSIAMGWGVEDDETFASLIEKDTGIKVLNLAVSSYGTVREFDIASRADASQLDTLIVQYFPNDLYENKTYLDNGNHLPISDKSTYEAISRQHLNTTRYFFGKHVLWLTGRLAGSLTGSASAQEESDEARHFFEVLFIKLDELSQRARLAPKSTMVVVEGLPWDVDTSRGVISKLRPRPNSISRILEIGYPTRPGHRYRLDGHLTAIGHRELADQIIGITRDKCYLEPVPVAGNEDENEGCKFFLDEL